MYTEQRHNNNTLGVATDYSDLYLLVWVVHSFVVETVVQEVGPSFGKRWDTSVIREGSPYCLTSPALGAQPKFYTLKIRGCQPYIEQKSLSYHRAVELQNSQVSSPMPHIRLSSANLVKCALK